MTQEQLSPLFSIQASDCDPCYGCVRSCPVTAITVQVNSQGPRIDPDRCIGCGACLVACPGDSVSYRTSLEEVNAILKSKSKVAAMVGPSIAGEFEDITDYRKFVQMIRSLGFDFVHEVSFGADLVAMQYRKLFEESKGKFYITANCPAVVSYVEKYHPDLISNLAPIVSPMIATANVLREIYGEEMKLVYIGPCVAAKDEALRSPKGSSVDAVLTFTELRALFRQHNVDEKKLEFSDFDPPYGYKGSLYPIPEGILQAASIVQDLLNGNVITVEGKEGMQRSVLEFGQNIDTIRHHFNLFYCEGCMMGPGTSSDGSKLRRRSAITRYAVKRLQDFDMESWESYVLRFGNMNFGATFSVRDQRLPEPSPEKIREILTLLGKDASGGGNGCAACGFRSCRDFAVSVANGLVKTDMCVDYALRSREQYITSLRKNNERLQTTHRELQVKEKDSREEMLRLQEVNERTSALIQKLHSAVVVADADLRVIQSNQNFIKLLGQEAEEISEVIPGLLGADLKTLLPYAFYNLFNFVLQNPAETVYKDVHLDDKLLNVTIFNIQKKKMVGAVIRDMYMPEVQKDEVIKRITEVITENLDMVQKIGFLLGEGASRTEKMLNSIIESYQSSGKIKPPSDE
jgi:iron only hydrogenase large subunit-like protein